MTIGPVIDRQRLAVQHLYANLGLGDAADISSLPDDLLCKLYPELSLVQEDGFPSILNSAPEGTTQEVIDCALLFTHAVRLEQECTVQGRALKHVFSVDDGSTFSKLHTDGGEVFRAVAKKIRDPRLPYNKKDTHWDKRYPGSPAHSAVQRGCVEDLLQQWLWNRTWPKFDATFAVPETSMMVLYSGLLYCLNAEKWLAHLKWTSFRERHNLLTGEKKAHEFLEALIARYSQHP